LAIDKPSKARNPQQCTLMNLKHVAFVRE